jgi:hypothetical protein
VKRGPALSLWASAWPHGPHMTLQGARAGRRGLCHYYSYKVGFITDFWVLIVIKPIFNGFWELLGSFGA